MEFLSVPRRPTRALSKAANTPQVSSTQPCAEMATAGGANQRAGSTHAREHAPHTVWVGGVTHGVSGLGSNGWRGRGHMHKCNSPRKGRLKSGQQRLRTACTAASDGNVCLRTPHTASDPLEAQRATPGAQTRGADLSD